MLLNKILDIIVGNLWVIPLSIASIIILWAICMRLCSRMSKIIFRLRAPILFKYYFGYPDEKGPLHDLLLATEVKPKLLILAQSLYCAYQTETEFQKDVAAGLIARGSFSKKKPEVVRIIANVRSAETSFREATAAAKTLGYNIPENFSAYRDRFDRIYQKK